MGKLLMDDQPLVVSPRLAQALGSLDQAVILQQLHYWLKKSKNFHDGRPWVYNSMEAWMKQFPWIKSRTTLTKHFNRLKKLGLVVTSNYNKAGFDKTTWYSIDYRKLQLFSDEFEKSLSTAENDCEQSIDQKLYNECTETKQRIDQKLNNWLTRNCTTNTRDYTEINQETTTDTAGQAKSLPEEMREEKEKIPYKQILDYLNQKTGKHYRNVKTNRDLIRARWNDGFRFDDFKTVIDNKVAEWLGTGVTFSGGQLAENYLQPSTLFSGKFDRYLNQTVNNAANDVPDEYKGLFDQQPEHNGETGDFPF